MAETSLNLVESTYPGHLPSTHHSVRDKYRRPIETLSTSQPIDIRGQRKSQLNEYRQASPYQQADDACSQREDGAESPNMVFRPNDVEVHKGARKRVHPTLDDWTAGTKHASTYGYETGIFAKRKDAYAPYVAIMPLVLGTSHRTQGHSTTPDEREHSIANQLLRVPFQSVGDIIGFAKVVRAQRSDALEQLNHVLTQPWTLRSKNASRGEEDHSHQNLCADSLPSTQRSDDEMED